MTEYPEDLAGNREEFLAKLKMNYCGDCGKFETSDCPNVKDKAAPVADSPSCPVYLKQKEHFPKHICGDCAAYKTTFCTWKDQAGYIKKRDAACSDFFPDRHLEPNHRRRRLRFDEVVTNL